MEATWLKSPTSQRDPVPVVQSVDIASRVLARDMSIIRMQSMQGTFRALTYHWVVVVVLVVLLLSCVWLFVTPWTAARQAPLFSTISQSLLKFMSIELVMLSNHLILCCPRLLLPSVFPGVRVFSSESAFHIRWPKYCSFSINSSGLLSFRSDWFDLLAVQATLKSLSQQHS